MGWGWGGGRFINRGYLSFFKLCLTLLFQIQWRTNSENAVKANKCSKTKSNVWSIVTSMFSVVD